MLPQLAYPWIHHYLNLMGKLKVSNSITVKFQTKTGRSKKENKDAVMNRDGAQHTPYEAETYFHCAMLFETITARRERT